MNIDYKTKIFVIFLISTPVFSAIDSEPAGEGAQITCIYEKPINKPFLIKAQIDNSTESAVKEAVHESADIVSFSIAIDVIWAYKNIKAYLPKGTTNKVIDEAVVKLIAGFALWSQKGLPLLAVACADNALKKYEVALALKEPKLKGLGIYSWVEGDFQEGSWQGDDLVFNNDSGVTAAFTGEAEFNISAGIIAEGEAKIQLKVSGTAGVQMLKLASYTANPHSRESSILVLSGRPYGRATGISSFELQAGFSGKTDILGSKDFTQEREFLTLIAIEREGVCGE
jgi:hypothetical protein